MDIPTQEIPSNQNASSTVFYDIKQLCTQGKPHLQQENYSVSVNSAVSLNFWIVIRFLSA